MTEVRSNFAGALKKIEEGQRQGVEDACQFILAESDEMVPHETGHLQTTGDYDVVEINGGVEGEVYYDTPYAMKQHEDLTLNHPNGREAKYLEKASRRNADRVGQIIGQAIVEQMY